MNSSSIIKRTLPLLVVLVIIIVVAILGTVLTREKSSPNISESDAYFLSADDYGITRQKVYDSLKSNSGYSLLIDLIDQHLLQDVNGKNYLDLVEESAIDESIDNAAYSNNKDGLTTEEQEEKLEAYYENMFLAGFRTEDAVRAYHRLVLARKLYVKDVVQEEYEDNLASTDEDKVDYITEQQITTYFNNNYKQDAASIIVPFATRNDVNLALQSLGIKLSNNETKWVKVVDGDTAADGDDLTQQEIVEAFIKLYNMVNAFKLENYPTETETLKAGEHYNVVGEEVEFVYEFGQESFLIHTHKEVNAMNASLANLLYNTLKNVGAEGSGNFYTPNARYYGTKHYLVLKLEVSEALEVADVRDEIIEELLEQKVSNAKVNTEMNNLRVDNSLVIYDVAIENTYVSQNPTFSKTKKASSTLVAQLDGFEVTVDALFEALVNRSGVIVAMDALNYEMLLRSDYNTTYDILTKEVLDKAKWQEYKIAVNDTKRAFSTGQFQGYNPSMGWDNFMKAYYNVNNEEELMLTFLYRDVFMEYSKEIASLDFDSNWDNVYLPLMNQIKDEFFSVTGIHLLIQAVDKGEGTVYPENFTEYQKDLAEELYDKVIADLAVMVGPNMTYAQALQKIQADFEKAPYLVSGFPVEDAEAAPIASADYTYSKFKSAGLTVLFQDLSTFGAGQMVEGFEDAARFIWQTTDTHNNKEARIYNASANPDAESAYLSTEFGYHVFVATNTTDIAYIDKDENIILPTKEQVELFLEDSTSDELSTAVLSAIKTYFEPVYTEMSSEYNLGIAFINQQQDLTISVSDANISSTLRTELNDAYQDLLDIYLRKYNEGFTLIRQAQD